jgi:hypothetical protein
VTTVTGSWWRIGAAAYRLLVANGAKVVVNGRDEAAIDAVGQRDQEYRELLRINQDARRGL